MILSLLRTTSMVAVLPETAVQPLCESGMLSTLIKNLGVEMGPFGIITRRHHRLSPGAQILLAALRETASKLYPGFSPRR